MRSLKLTRAGRPGARSLTAAVVTASAATAALAGAGPAVASTCHAGVHPYGGTEVRTYCGPARVSATIGRTTRTLSGGACNRTRQALKVNIGSELLGSTRKPAPNYFGLIVGKAGRNGTPATKDGTYSALAFTLYAGHHEYVVIQSRVKLTNNRTRGSFSGRLLSGQRFSGSFRCR